MPIAATTYGLQEIRQMIVLGETRKLTSIIQADIDNLFDAGILDFSEEYFGGLLCEPYRVKIDLVHWFIPFLGRWVNLLKIWRCENALKTALSQRRFD